MRTPRWIVLALAVASLGYGGCIFQNLSPTRLLTDQVEALNDETRWARVDLATDRVSPEYRAVFLASHRGWGRDIQIADSELTNVTMAENEESATSLVTLAWYDLRSMEVRSTVITQHWVKTDLGFLLDEENVVDGDEALLSFPETEASEEPDGIRPEQGPLARAD